MDLECWMGCMRDNIKDKKLSEIVIPGSHDSGTYCITSRSKRTYLLPDLGSCLNPLVDIVGAPWAKTQPYSIAVQLRMGVRYIDLRVFHDLDTDQFVLVHSFEAAPLRDEIRTIADFVKSHPTEIVIVDVNHIYQCEEEDLERMLTIFDEEFPELLSPVPQLSSGIPTYGQMIESGKRVIIAASERPECFKSRWSHTRVQRTFPWLWSSEENIKSPWGNTFEVDKLLTYLKMTMSWPRSPVSLHVCQTILTAQDFDTVAGIIRPPSSVKEAAAILHPNLASWYREFKASYNLNITIMDFVDKDTIELLINLNKPEGEVPSTDTDPMMGKSAEKKSREWSFWDLFNFRGGKK